MVSAWNVSEGKVATFMLSRSTCWARQINIGRSEGEKSVSTFSVRMKSVAIESSLRPHLLGHHLLVQRIEDDGLVVDAVEVGVALADAGEHNGRFSVKVMGADIIETEWVAVGSAVHRLLQGDIDAANRVDDLLQGVHGNDAVVIGVEAKVVIQGIRQQACAARLPGIITHGRGCRRSRPG